MSFEERKVPHAEKASVPRDRASHSRLVISDGRSRRMVDARNAAPDERHVRHEQIGAGRRGRRHNRIYHGDRDRPRRMGLQHRRPAHRRRRQRSVGPDGCRGLRGAEQPEYARDRDRHGGRGHHRLVRRAERQPEAPHPEDRFERYRPLGGRRNRHRVRFDQRIRFTDRFRRGGRRHRRVLGVGIEH